MCDGASLASFTSIYQHISYFRHIWPTGLESSSSSKWSERSILTMAFIGDSTSRNQGMALCGLVDTSSDGGRRSSGLQMMTTPNTFNDIGHGHGHEVRYCYGVARGYARAAGHHNSGLDPRHGYFIFQT